MKKEPKFNFDFFTGEDASESEIQDRIGEWDSDGDGKINFAEFLNAMTKILTDTENEDRMKTAFELFDKVSRVHRWAQGRASEKNPPLPEKRKKAC